MEIVMNSKTRNIFKFLCILALILFCWLLVLELPRKSYL